MSSRQDRTRRRAALLVAGVVLVSGCGTDEQATTATTAPVTAWSDQLYSPTTRPWNETLSVIDSAVGSNDAYAAAIAKRDAAVVTCMTNAGFAAKSAKGSKSSTPVSTAEPVKNGEFAKQYGFGIAAPYSDDGRPDPGFAEAQLAASSAAAPATPAGDIPVFGPDGPSLSDYGDPNAMAALFGGPTSSSGSGSGSGSGTDTGPSSGGCFGQANLAAGFVQGQGRLAAAARLRHDAVERVRTDPAILQAATTYEACLATAGFPGISGPDQAAASIQSAFKQLTVGVFQGQTGQAGTAGDIPADKLAQLQQLKARELQLAAANVGCRDAFERVAAPRRDEIQRKVLADEPAVVAQLAT